MRTTHPCVSDQTTSQPPDFEKMLQGFQYGLPDFAGQMPPLSNNGLSAFNGQMAPLWNAFPSNNAPYIPNNFQQFGTFPAAQQGFDNDFWTGFFAFARSQPTNAPNCVAPQQTQFQPSGVNDFKGLEQNIPIDPKLLMMPQLGYQQLGYQTPPVTPPSYGGGNPHVSFNLAPPASLLEQTSAWPGVHNDRAVTPPSSIQEFGGPFQGPFGAYGIQDQLAVQAYMTPLSSCSAASTPTLQPSEPDPIQTKKNGKRTRDSTDEEDVQVQPVPKRRRSRAKAAQTPSTSNYKPKGPIVGHAMLSGATKPGHCAFAHCQVKMTDSYSDVEKHLLYHIRQSNTVSSSATRSGSGNGTTSSKSYYQCSLCPWKQLEVRRMAAHISADHMGVRTTCLSCFNDFSRSDAGIRHRHPNGVGTCLKCINCGMQFGSGMLRFAHEQKCPALHGGSA